MIIKKFQGKTEQDAIESAEKELGGSIVLMNTKNVKRKGLMRFFMPQLVEVTVAKEEEPDRVQAVRQELNREATDDEVRETLQAAIKEAAQARSVTVQEKRIEEDAVSPERELEQRLDNLQSLLEKQLNRTEEKEASEAVEVEDEYTENARFVKLLYNTLIENEVSEKYANMIIDDLDKSAKIDMPIDVILSNVYQKTILKFGEPCGITPAKAGAKFIFFIGPTGVGKTTTIAKIAAKLKVEQKKKIALLTSDTYRIAAAEQLRTYANILEVPFRIIYSADDVKEAYQSYQDYDYILMDTSGHAHRNEEQREMTKSLLHALDGEVETEVYLVVSATTKYSDLVSIADSYLEMTEYRLIFTKLDETISLGNLLNLKLHTGAELSYVTCGQNVPEDIENFNPQKAVKVLLSGK